MCSLYKYLSVVYLAANVLGCYEYTLSSALTTRQRPRTVSGVETMSSLYPFWFLKPYSAFILHAIPLHFLNAQFDTHALPLPVFSRCNF